MNAQHTHHMKRRNRLLVPYLITALAATACDSSSRSDQFVVRDSAGIHIVESFEQQWDEGSGWLLSGEPTLEIGVEEGAEQYQFYRIGGALRLDDGAILVTDGGSGELRFYDATGEFVRAVGGKGAGPGEFGDYSSMRMWRAPEGRVGIWDGANDRGNVFDTVGSFHATIKLEQTEELPRGWARGIFDDGSWLVESPVGGGILEGEPGDVIRMEYAYSRYGANGDFISTLIRAPTRPRYVNLVEGGNVIHYPFIPLTPVPQTNAQADMFYAWRGPDPEITSANLSGDRSIIRWSPLRQRVADVWDRYRAAALQEIPDDGTQRRYARLFDQDLPLLEHVPVASTLLIDTEGNMWIERYRLPWEEDPVWDVIDASGHWLGTVNTPRRFNLFDIGPDYVLGRHRDDLGVERIRLYTLHR